MVSADVELVRSIYAVWQGGDYSSAEWAQPEIAHSFDLAVTRLYGRTAPPRPQSRVAGLPTAQTPQVSAQSATYVVRPEPRALNAKPGDRRLLSSGVHPHWVPCLSASVGSCRLLG
jgi:hypothetical protein